jgi:hypothetical protein
MAATLFMSSESHHATGYTCLFDRISKAKKALSHGLIGLDSINAQNGWSTQGQQGKENARELGERHC